MIIRELDMRHYGRFEEQKMTFHSGINIIYGPNESGKTTMHSFIRAMFFGLSSRKGGGRQSEYELRRPWVDPGYFEGSMEIEYASRIYRIDRVFEKGEKNVRLVCETDAQELNAAPEELQKLLMGMNEAAFLNTVFIRQGSIRTDDSLEEILRNYMMRMKQTGDARLNLEEACGRLAAQKKKLESEEKEEKRLLEEQIRQKEMQLELLVKQQEREREMLAASSREEPGSIDVPDHSRRNPQADRRERSEERKKSRMFTALIWMCLLAAVLGIACALVTDDLPGKILMLALSMILFLITGVLTWLRPGGGRAAADERNEGEKDRPQDAGKRLLEEEEQKTARQAAALRQELNALTDQAAAKSRNASDREAIDLALERIRSLSDRICEEAGDDFDRNASEILSELTGGRYTRIALDEKHQIRVMEGENLLMIDQISYAAGAQVYLAMRLAAGELMSGENLPLIMDDPFASYDDERLEAALRFLEKGERQVILFTSGKREARLLEKIRS